MNSTERSRRYRATQTATAASPQRAKGARARTTQVMQVRGRAVSRRPGSLKGTRGQQQDTCASRGLHDICTEGKHRKAAFTRTQLDSMLLFLEKKPANRKETSIPQEQSFF